MAKDGKTEKATPKKRKKQREEGKVVKSKELGVFFNFFGFSVLFLFFGESFVKQLIKIQRQAFDYMKQGVVLEDFLVLMLQEVGKMFLIVAAVGLVFMIINYLIQVQFLFSIKAVRPDFKRINPANYFKNLFSRKKFVDVVKSLLIVSILGSILYFVFKDELSLISSSVNLPWKQSLFLMVGIFKKVIIISLICLGVIGFADLFYQRFELEEDMKMSKHEVKDEYKSQEGDPQFKGKRKKAANEMLQTKKDIMNKTPEATFIATNPTHYSVAIRYKRGEGPPKVMTKGVDNYALMIREVAKNHDIPLYEDPPLARELYSRVLENDVIPEDMYMVIIGVLRKLNDEKKVTIE